MLKQFGKIRHLVARSLKQVSFLTIPTGSYDCFCRTKFNPNDIEYQLVQEGARVYGVVVYKPDLVLLNYLLTTSTRKRVTLKNIIPSAVSDLELVCVVNSVIQQSDGTLYVILLES